MPIRPENRGRYPADWPEVRARILERATLPSCGGPTPCCECEGECGRDHRGRCSNGDGWRAFDSDAIVVLTVAHLDHTPENCEPENLRAFCQGCHNRYDAEHRAETRRETERRARADAGQLELGV